MAQLASESYCSKENKSIIIKLMENKVAMQNKWYQVSQHQHNNSRSCSLSHQKKIKNKRDRKKKTIITASELFQPVRCCATSPTTHYT